MLDLVTLLEQSFLVTIEKLLSLRLLYGACSVGCVSVCDDVFSIIITNNRLTSNWPVRCKTE